MKHILKCPVAIIALLTSALSPDASAEEVGVSGEYELVIACADTHHELTSYVVEPGPDALVTGNASAVDTTATFTDAALTTEIDGDVWSKLLEYAYGIVPTVGDHGSLEYVLDGEVTGFSSPVLFESPAGSGAFLAMVARSKDYTTAGLTYSSEYSVEVGEWTASPEAPTVSTGASNAEDFVASVPYPARIPLEAVGHPNSHIFQRPGYFQVVSHASSSSQKRNL